MYKSIQKLSVMYLRERATIQVVDPSRKYRMCSEVAEQYTWLLYQYTSLTCILILFMFTFLGDFKNLMNEVFKTVISWYFITIFFLKRIDETIFSKQYP